LRRFRVQFDQVALRCLRLGTQLLEREHGVTGAWPGSADARGSAIRQKRMLDEIRATALKAEELGSIQIVPWPQAVTAVESLAPVLAVLVPQQSQR
jgi:hypothetical protein